MHTVHTLPDLRIAAGPLRDDAFGVGVGSVKPGWLTLSFFGPLLNLRAASKTLRS